MRNARVNEFSNFKPEKSSGARWTFFEVNEIFLEFFQQTFQKHDEKFEYIFLSMSLKKSYLFPFISQFLTRRQNFIPVYATSPIDVNGIKLFLAQFQE